MLRFVCATVPEGHEEFILATKDRRGRLREDQKVQLRISSVTPWLEVPSEELHLCIREGRDLISKCSFTYPKGTRRAVVVLLPDENASKEAEDDTSEEKADEEAEKNVIKAQLIDTSKYTFGKGDILLINSSDKSGEVKLGENTVEAKPGEISVQKPSLNEQGMYHLLVSYTNEAGEAIICRDNFLQGNDIGRDYLVLTPDPEMGFKVFNLTEFGPFK